MWSFSGAFLRRKSRIRSVSCADKVARQTPVSYISTRSYSHENDKERKIALVLGSSGALGSTVARYLSREQGMTVLGADVVEVPSDFNSSDWELDGFVSLPTMAQRPSVADISAELASGIFNILHNEQIDTIVCASGGWGGDPKPMVGQNLEAEQVLLGAHEYGEAIDKMIYMNLVPVIAAGYSAQTFMGPNGLFVVMGATAALASTPGMLGYGMAKAGCHHIVQTLGATTANSLDTKVKKREGRRQRQFASNMGTMSVVGILPATIDTPSNRQAMPEADLDSWTKPLDIAQEIGKWIETPSLRPHSGALVKVSSTADGPVFEIAR